MKDYRGEIKKRAQFDEDDTLNEKQKLLDRCEHYEILRQDMQTALLKAKARLEEIKTASNGVYDSWLVLEVVNRALQDSANAKKRYLK